MSFKNFIKDNIVLLTGIFLPLLLVVFFILSSSIPNMLTEPPKYDFLFKKEHYKNKSHAKIDIRVTVNDDGYLVGKVIKNENPSNMYTEIYRYRAKDGYAVPVKTEYFLDYIIDNKKTLTEDSDVKIPKYIAKLSLNTETVSPDGYSLDSTYNYRSGGIFGEVFRTRNRRCQYRLVKNNATFPFKINQVNNNNYHCNFYDRQIKFLGWITE